MGLGDIGSIVVISVFVLVLLVIDALPFSLGLSALNGLIKQRRRFESLEDAIGL